MMNQCRCPVFSDCCEVIMTTYVNIPLDELPSTTGWSTLFLETASIPTTTLQEYLNGKDPHDTYQHHGMPKPLLQKYLTEFLETHPDPVVQLQDWLEFLKPRQEKYLERRNQINSSRPDLWLRLFYDLSQGEEQFEIKVFDDSLEHVSSLWNYFICCFCIFQIVFLYLVARLFGK